MEILLTSVPFASMRGSELQSISVVLEPLPRNVRAVAAGITGYTIGYTQGGGDHWIGKMQVGVAARATGNVVTLDVSFGLRDWSGDVDDLYEGRVDIAVLADLDPLTAPAHRTDLDIRDAEISQATQYFNAQLFLDNAFVRPNNSMPLVAGKATGVRLFVNYEAGAGLPPIARLTGQLELRSPDRAAVGSVAPWESIVPRPIVQIDQRLAAHTLNFTIPPEWCRGDVEVHARVWDESSPATASYEFVRTLRFNETAPLRIWAVGLNVNGAQAVTREVFEANYSFLKKVFPLERIDTQGYSMLTVPGTVDFSDNTAMFPILDMLRDLRGNTYDDERYVALVPPEVLIPAGGTPAEVWGRGDGSTRCVVAGAVPTVVAHEVAHTIPSGIYSHLGHPEDDPGPLRTGAPRDGIALTGVDPLGQRVLDPLTKDFMSINTNPDPWVSPDDYQIMFTYFDADGNGAARGAVVRAGGATRDVLFFGMTVDRNGDVTRRPSFHYPAPFTSRRLFKASFVVDLLDESGKLLVSHPLEDDHDSNEWPRHFRNKVPFPSKARQLNVYEGRRLIYEEKIPRAPSVVGLEFHHEKAANAGELRWSVEPASEHKGDFFYLVHWQDVDGTWRGVAPRLTEQSLQVPLSLFKGRSQMRLRVLATCGIATGCAEIEAEAPADCHQAPPPEILVASSPPLGRDNVLQAGVLEVAVADAWGRTIRPTVLWYSENGVQLASGTTIDLRALAPGKHTVRAEAIFDKHTVTRTWMVQVGKRIPNIVVNQRKRRSKPVNRNF